MTYTTHFAIQTPMPPDRILDAATEAVRTHDRPVIRMDPFELAGGRWTLRNLPGQGLGALVWITWQEDGPMPRESEEAPKSVAALVVDTPYHDNYHDQKVGKVAAALEALGIRFWINEEHGRTWHSSFEEWRSAWLRAVSVG